MVAVPMLVDDLHQGDQLTVARKLDQLTPGNVDFQVNKHALMHGKTIHDASNIPSHVLMFPFRRTAFEVGHLVCLRESYPNLLLAMGLDLPQTCSSSDNSAHVPEPF